MNIKDAVKTLVNNFPNELKGLQIIVDKKDGETYLSKELFTSAVKEYIEQADFWNCAVKTRPDAGKPFLYHTVNGKVMVCANRELDDWFIDKYSVTHWMYLPNSPKN